jgi:lactoylglutathione lyase
MHFYCDIFGFTAGYRWPTTGDPEFIVLRLDNSALGLCDQKVLAELLHLPIAARGAPQTELCLLVEEMEKTCTYLRLRGVRELLPPTLRPWGEYAAYFADPDGNPIQLYTMSDDTIA